MKKTQTLKNKLVYIGLNIINKQNSIVWDLV